LKRVLFIAYHFPPLGGAGVQRSVKFARYLPEFGWEPAVVAGPLGGTESLLRDETFQRELPHALDLRRAAGPEPASSSGWSARAERWLRRRSAWSDWWVGAASAAARQLGDVDLVYASMSPWESGDAAARVAAELGLPWIADLRDPWALDESFVYPTRLHRTLELRRMERLLSSAAAVVMNTPEAAQVSRSLRALAARRVEAIPNGFDLDDFSGPPPSTDSARFRIVHTGHVHTEVARADGKARFARRALGGMLGPIDFFARSHLYLLQAVEGLLAERPELRSTVEVHLAGPLSERDRLSLPEDLVRYHGYLPHAQAVALMRSADLLFLPLHDLPPGTRARIVPGKTYEYLASGRPILAALPDGDARDLLSRTEGAFVCRPADVAGMRDVLRDRVRAFEDGEPIAPRNGDSIRPYERRTLTARLAALFEDVLRS
jgi:glycosyltransferase involved in cell wall biosynthesis